MYDAAYGARLSSQTILKSKKFGLILGDILDLTLTGLTKRVETYITQQFAGVDVLVIDKVERELIEGLRRLVIDLKLDLRDYEHAETRVEQQKYLADAKVRLEELRAMVLRASSHNLFGAVDVAHVTALLEQINELIV